MTETNPSSNERVSDARLEHLIRIAEMDCRKTSILLKDGGYSEGNIPAAQLRALTELRERRAVETSERRERAWLVESGAAAPNTEYRYMDQMGFHWTKDINKAIRFARREDAEMAAAGDEDAWSIVEHEWVTPSSPEEPSEQPPVETGLRTGELAQLRRIDAAARFYVDSVKPSSGLAWENLMNALFDGRPEKASGRTPEQDRILNANLDQVIWPSENGSEEQT